MRKPAFLQPRILKRAVAAALSRPYTTKFPAEPYEPQEAFRGRPRFNAEGCIGCGACAQVCPPKCIEVRDEVDAARPVRVLVQHFDACIMCGQCERYCPTGAGIRMSTDWDTAGFKPEDFEERVEKTLVTCEVCGEVLAPADQLRWVTRRLQAVAFANPTLAMFRGKDAGYVQPGVRSQSDTPLRQDRMAVQCAKCRRQSAYAA